MSMAKTRACKMGWTQKQSNIFCHRSLWGKNKQKKMQLFDMAVGMVDATCDELQRRLVTQFSKRTCVAKDSHEGKKTYAFFVFEC
jgi:hypothetical protein